MLTVRERYPLPFYDADTGNMDPAKNMKAYKDMMLITHVIAACKSAMSSTDQQFERVEDLGREIVSNDLDITGQNYEYRTQVLPLYFCGMGSMMLHMKGDCVLRY